VKGVSGPCLLDSVRAITDAGEAGQWSFGGYLGPTNTGSQVLLALNSHSIASHAFWVRSYMQTRLETQGFGVEAAPCCLCMGLSKRKHSHLEHNDKGCRRPFDKSMENASPYLRSLAFNNIFPLS